MPKGRGCVLPPYFYSVIADSALLRTPLEVGAVDAITGVPAGDFSSLPPSLLGYFQSTGRFLLALHQDRCDHADCLLSYSQCLLYQG